MKARAKAPTAIDLATGCFDLSDNFITVIREVPDAGSISLEDGTNEISFCSGDAMMDSLVFINTSSTSANYAYIIGQEGFALTAITDSSFDFSNTFTGTYTIYGVAYTGTLTILPGQEIATTDLSTDCFDLSDTTITINVTRVDGGFIRGNGAQEVYLCPENPEDGFVTFTTNSILNDTLFRYVITTATDVILAVLDSNSFDFGPLPLQELRVYAISYTGNFLAGPGSSLRLSPLASGCVSLSDNFVTVFNDSPEGGMVSLSGVPPSAISCTVDGDGDITVLTTSTSLTGYVVLVTDTNNVVQLIADDLANVPLGDLPVGDYRIHGLAYTGNLLVSVGDDADDVALADNCYELSSNFATVTQGGSISAGTLTNLNEPGDTINFCIPAGDNPIAIVEASVVGPNYRYIITNANGIIRAANLPSNILPFGAFGPGEYRIYGFNYTGEATVSINQPITGFLSSACYALTSNFITVIYEDPDGGMIATAEGQTEVTVDIDTASTDPSAVVTFVSTSDSLNSFIYVVTDEDNVILSTSNSASIDFGAAGLGVCRVWGLAYTGNLLAAVGDNAATTELSDGCYALSDNFVTVTRAVADGFAAETPAENGSVAGADDVQLSAFPNPSAGSEIFLTLSSELGLPSGQIAVRDLNGRAYQVQPLTGGVESVTVRLDISNLPAGLYFAQFSTPTGVQSIRFMKR